MQVNSDVFLKDEYLKLQDQYEDYDRRALQIKGWIGTAAIAGFTLGIDASKNIDSRTLISISLIALCFWYLEAKWKTFQYATSDRIRIIEAHFRGDKDILLKNPKPFQIYNSWYSSFIDDLPIYQYEEKTRPTSQTERLFESARQSFVHLPYSLIIGICLSMFLWQLIFPN